MRLKPAVKRAAVTVGRLLPRPRPHTRRVVLCYHSVHPKRPFYATTPDIFERHLEWLTAHCRLTSFTDLVTDAHGDQDAKPLAAITFDDGYDDNYDYALPILLKWGVPATFFLTAGFVERDPAVLCRFYDLLGCRPDDMNPLSWAQVRELYASGMHIGSHTYSHPNLVRLTTAQVEVELSRSKALISDRLGCEIDLLAYPFGKPKANFTATTAGVARATGYRIAAAVIFREVRETDSLFAIPRFFADGDSLTKLQAKIDGAYALLGWWQEHAPTAIMRMVSPDQFYR